MQKLSRKEQLFVGITLFSMFFGAGNLIFPPFLGFSSGTAVLPAFLGFALSAIGLPILGVIGATRSGGIKLLAGRVSPSFASVFTMLIYLSIGPCLAIPRTASTSFEMAVTPFIGKEAPSALLSILYSVLFFGVALALALHPLKLVDLLGKRLAPILLVLIAVLFFGCVFFGKISANTPAAAYQSIPAAQGFLDGYQTMDAIAALIFGLMLAANINARGITENHAVIHSTVIAGGIASVLFLCVYGALTFIGFSNGNASAQNGAQLLSISADRLFGKAGAIILAAIFVIACLNTCISLICCCAQYFSQLFPRFSYRTWASFFAVFSAILANAGLNMILKISVPILNCLYPIAIVLIALAFFPKRLQEKPLLFPLSITLTGIVSVIYALYEIGIQIPVLTDLTSALPLYSAGLGWICPAAVGIILALLIPNKKEA